MATAPDIITPGREPNGITYRFGTRVPMRGEAVEVAEGVRWVRVAVPGSLKHINCWLLDDEGGAALVDTGMNLAQTRAEWDGIAAGPLAGTRITRVIGTHFHPDHVGLAGWIGGRHRAPLVMTRGEWLTARLLAADARDEVPDEMIALWRAGGWSDEQLDDARGNGWSRFRQITAPMPLGYVRIRDGEVLTLGRRRWRVVVGAGHSPEHACLLDEERGLLVSGDQVLPRISSNVSLNVTEPQGDPLGDWLESLARFRELPADLLVLPAHGEPFTGLHARLDALIAEHSERLDAVAGFAAAPCRAVDCFGLLFRREIGPDQLGMATGEALAHLRRLEIEGRVTREDRGGVWWWRAS